MEITENRTRNLISGAVSLLLANEIMIGHTSKMGKYAFVDFGTFADMFPDVAEWRIEYVKGEKALARAHVNYQGIEFMATEWFSTLLDCKKQEAEKQGLPFDEIEFADSIKEEEE